MNKRSLRVLFLSVCATVVSVAIWVVAVVLNLVHALWGKTDGSLILGWAITLISAVVFFVVFYRHFSKTED